MAGRIGLVMETILSVAVIATFWFQLLDASSNPNEGKTLLSMKASFSKAAQDLLNWDEANGDHCSWRGVVCHNKTFNVMMLNLSSANVGGALGGELSPAIGDLKFLEHIDFEGSGLSGQIPDEIGNCISLKSLDLAFNSLNGDIPFSISQLKGLQFISLKANELTGPIPSTLSQIPTLQFIDLALNQLTGEIPRLIYWNEMLQYLGLRDNQLTGTLSSDICQLSGLWYFDVRGNNLTGPIPHTIGNCTSFEILDLSYNQFTGEIPYNIGFLQVATLSLQGNKLTGKIPEVIGLMQALAVLDLSNNQLTGEIPPILGNLSYTGKLYLNGNQFTGHIPPEFGNMSRLSYLQLHDNQLVGTIPAELGKLEDLFALNLANNHLEGPIPQNISSCTSLNQFNVHGNLLNGSISVGFEKLESLTYLNLSSNKFSGEIPDHLGHIINLDTLDLSDNELVGQIPPALGDLEHLLELNLSRNHLTGPIPPEFGNLKNIQTVDLSNNAINGEIPQDLGQLLNLASLTLSNNSIQGMIPTQLSNCFSLTNLNLSFNNLSGEIPTTNNFSKFPSSSFIGNPFLCGNFAGSSSCSNSMQVQPDKFPKAAIALITFGVFTIVALLVLALWRSNRKINIVKGSSKSSSGYPKMVILHMDMAVHTYEDIMRLTDNLSEKHVIGYGATSIVYKCVLKNCKPIAVKRLHANANSLRDFENELATIGSIKHRNLVCLRGYSLSPHGNLLFYEYMENGSLWDLLHGPTKKVKLDWDTRLKIAVGAAQGLAYLHHDCNPRIVHRDVKSSNILLDENFVAHISDFGIARSIGATKTHASTYVLGTIGYIDPEYARTSRINEKSDVYSFGVVLLELLTGKKPVDDESNLHQEVMTKVEYGNVMEAIDSEVTVTCTDLRQVKKTLQLALLCTRESPSERPTMYDVSKVLVSLMVLQPTSSSKMSSPTAKVASDSRYVDEYADRQLNRDDIKASPPAGNTNNSSDDQWFVKFREVISQNSR